MVVLGFGICNSLISLCWHAKDGDFYNIPTLWFFVKAKYFPTQSFLEASVRGHASYLWRSICEAKESLKLGLRWRVGNGAHIKIWKDARVLTNSNAMVLSPVHVLDEDAMVEQLIDPVRMCWKEGLID